MYNSMTVQLSQGVVQLSPQNNFRIFTSPPKHLLCSFAVTCCSHTQPLVNTHVVRVSVDLPLQSITYEWNHTVCGLLLLSSLTQHNVFETYSCVACIRTSLLFIAELYSIVWIYCVLLIQSPEYRHLGCVRFLTTRKTTLSGTFNRGFLDMHFLLCLYKTCIVYAYYTYIYYVYICIYVELLDLW